MARWDVARPKTAAITHVFPNRDQQGAALAQTTTVTPTSDSRFTTRRRSHRYRLSPNAYRLSEARQVWRAGMSL